MQHKIIVLLATLIITLLSTVISAQSFTKVENIFQPNFKIEPGDTLTCKITKTEENINQFHVRTLEGSNVFSYHLLPTSEKCFSFKVRASKDTHIILSSTNFIDNQKKIEVILEYTSVQKEVFAAIRETTPNNENYLDKYVRTGLVDDSQYHGFWIRWLDEQTVEVGKESEIKPILSHVFPNKLQINYVGFMTWWVRGDWIIDLEPKCPGINVRKTKAESNCVVL